MSTEELVDAGITRVVMQGNRTGKTSRMITALTEERNRFARLLRGIHALHESCGETEDVRELRTAREEVMRRCKPALYSPSLPTEGGQ